MGMGSGDILFSDASAPAGPSGGGGALPALAGVWQRGWFRGLTIAVAAIGGIYAAAAAIVPLVDLAPYTRPLETSLSQALGRDVIISGGTHLNLFPRLALKLNGVFVANAQGAPSKYFIVADHMTANMMLDVTAPALVIDEIAVDGVNLNLERTPKGVASWTVNPIAKPLDAGLANIIVRPRTILVTNFRLSRPGDDGAEALMTGRAIWLHPKRGSDVLRVFAHNSGGAWNGEARIAGLAALSTGAPVQIAVDLTGPGTTLSLKGGRETKGASLVVAGEGTSKDFSALERFFGLPGGQPHVDATFTVNLTSDPQSGALKVAFPTLGAGDLVLDATYKTGPEHEFLGKLTAKHLDLKAFLPSSWLAGADSLFSRAPIGPGLWQGRVKLDLTAEHVTLGTADLGAGMAGLFADRGVLSAGPVRLAGPDGTFSGDVTLDLRATPQLALTLKADVPSLGALLAALGQPSLDGRLDAAIELSGQGASLADIMAHAAGQTNLLFGQGKVAPKLAEALPNQLAFGRATAPSRELNPEDPLATPAADESLIVGCLISRFDIESGRARSRAFLLETAQAITTGEGEIDLAKQAFDLHLRPRPRDPALIGEAQDLKVSGPIRAPKWAPEAGDPRRGLARAPGRVATADDFAGFMPLLDAQAGLANPCVKTLMGESAIASGSAKPQASR